MSSERAGTPTHGRLNREKAREAILATMGLRAWNESAPESVLNALEACVVPDPRLSRIEALCAEAYHWIDGTDSTVSLHQLEAILRGDQ